MTHYKYPSIEQFRHVYKAIREQAEYDNLPYPTINFSGTVKLHGVNAAVVQLPDGTRYAQSRNKIITPEDDHMGFAKYVVEHKHSFDVLFNAIQHPKETVIVFGEFAGKGIQKNIGISKLPKSFYAFEIESHIEDTSPTTTEPWLNPELNLPAYNAIQSFYYKSIAIDFSKSLEELTTLLAPYTQEVEDCCPVAAHYLPDDTNLIGEGVVWKAMFNDKVIRFKVKGDKHSKASRVPKQPFTPEELANTANYDRVARQLFSPERCQQAIFEIYGPNWEQDISYKELGTYLKWVLEDTWKEEYDILEEAKLTTKQVSKPLSRLARTYFIGLLNDTRTTS